MQVLKKAMVTAALVTVWLDASQRSVRAQERTDERWMLTTCTDQGRPIFDGPHASLDACEALRGTRIGKARSRA